MNIVSFDFGLAVVLIARIILLVLFVFFLLNLQRTLEAVSFHNRQIAPGLVWLNLIPVFNLVWPFILNVKISRSIRRELEERQGPSDYDNYAFISGLVYPVFIVIGATMEWVWNPFPYNSGSSKIIGLLTLIAIVFYWYQTAAYKRQIREMGENLNIKNDLLDSF